MTNENRVYFEPQPNPVRSVMRVAEKVEGNDIVIRSYPWDRGECYWGSAQMYWVEKKDREGERSMKRHNIVVQGEVKQRGCACMQ